MLDSTATPMVDDSGVGVGDEGTDNRLKEQGNAGALMHLLWSLRRLSPHKDIIRHETGSRPGARFRFWQM